MITSSLLNGIPGIRHGFGTALALVPEVLQPLWTLRPDKKQVHGTEAVHITTPQQAVGHADAFFTSTPGIPVSVITADCVPLLLARRDGGMVAAVHAGWRGLYDGIIGATLAQLAQAGTPAASLVAAIGPTICANCYEVSEELAGQFASHYAALPREVVLPAHRHLDLRALAAHELRTAGVQDLEHVGGCTFCARDGAGHHIYRSYRRGDRNSQMHAGLYITPKGDT
uniref:Purine nucleoside phosphorylase n=1 Tax=uncultured bacterium AOCarb11 TaxID=654972 RepID=D6MLY3_9BACT|nr:hypothetical protein WISOIL_0034 [uncultured bacterium AOCarb11]